jgi:hypothetical protein
MLAYADVLKLGLIFFKLWVNPVFSDVNAATKGNVLPSFMALATLN